MQITRQLQTNYFAKENMQLDGFDYCNCKSWRVRKSYWVVATVQRLYFVASELFQENDDHCYNMTMLGFRACLQLIVTWNVWCVLVNFLGFACNTFFYCRKTCTHNYETSVLSFSLRTVKNGNIEILVHEINFGVHKTTSVRRVMLKST